MPHFVEIMWGLGLAREEDDKPKRYQFATRELLNAFMEGVEETSGWLEHEVLEDSRDA